MPKVIDDHATRNLLSCLVKRSSLKPPIYIMRKLGVCRATATKYINNPLEMRLGDIKALGLSLEDIGGLL